MRILFTTLLYNQLLKNFFKKRKKRKEERKEGRRKKKEKKRKEKLQRLKFYLGIFPNYDVREIQGGRRRKEGWVARLCVSSTSASPSTWLIWIRFDLHETQGWAHSQRATSVSYSYSEQLQTMNGDGI